MSTVIIGVVNKRRAFKAEWFVNAAFIFVPMAVLGEWLGADGVFVFVCAALSCVPLSYWLGQATEALSAKLGPVSGGLLNASFGNAAELIISIFALSQGLFIVVRTALIGSILGQLLLVLGTSLLLAGLRHGELKFSRSLVQVNFTLIAIVLAAIALPTVLVAAAPGDAKSGLSVLGPALAFLLLILYAMSVVYSLKSQPTEEGDLGGPKWSPRTGMFVLAGTTAGMIMISELLVGSILPVVEETGISQTFIGLIIIPIFGNVVDHIVAITVALKNRMDLSLTISVGSAAQVAGLILPIVVLIGAAMGQTTGLIFAPVELIALGLGLLLMIGVLLDGSSNWVEGAQLLTCYLILATVLWAL